MNALRSAVVLVCLLAAVAVLAAPSFPKLTGRVVDQAGLLSTAVEQRLTEQLAEHELATTNQVVVATLPDLQGYDIETFGYQLGRHWRLGQKDQNNGVLLLVAKQERKVRIEVGYGLEGELTDAISANIIHTVILPDFKAGRFEAGIAAGVQAIIQALGGQYQVRERQREQEIDSPLFAFLVFIFVVLSLVSSFFGGGGRGYGRYYGTGGGRRGGFSGGGGSFGGGGASGGW